MPAFLLGVNYWPRRTAMYMWRRFDLGEIREDMVRLRALGLHVVRFFLSWDDFAPGPRELDPAMLRRFDAMMGAIADAGLRAMPTLFCGHMSGVNWLPAWTLDSSRPHGRFRTIAGGASSPFGIGDFYADPQLLDAQCYFAKRIAERANGHPALYLWDLGNEFSNLREPRTAADGAAWSERLSSILASGTGAPVTGGMHGEDLEYDRNLRPSSMAVPWDIATMHGYSIYARFARDRRDTSVVPFYAALMSSFARKPLLFSEFGNPACPTTPPMQCLNQEEMAAYCEGVLDKLHAQGAIGALWWCYSDYDPRLRDLPPFDRAPHEMRFGIVRDDGSYKPVAYALSRFARRSAATLPPRPPIAEENAFYASLPRGIDALYRDYRR